MAAGEDKGQGGEARGVVVEGLAESRRELDSPLGIEPAEELSGETGGGFTAREGGPKEGWAFWHQGGEAASRGGAQGLAFLFKQGLAVSGVFDELMTVIGAAMGSDFVGTVEQTHRGGRSHQGQSVAQGLGRHGVVIEIEADAESFIGLRGAHQVAGEGVNRKRQ